MWYNTPINADILKLIQSFSNPTLDSFFQLITMMGGETFFTVAAVIIYWCLNKELGYKLGFAFLSSCILNTGIKDVLKIPRPIGEPGIRSISIDTAPGYSFPSGHTQGSSSFWVSIMSYMRQGRIYALGIVIILLVGTSRLYLGVHRPIDVLAGLIIGTLWVFIFNKVYDYGEKNKNKKLLLIVIIPIIVLMAVFKTDEYYKMAGLILGFYLGYIIEPRYINYDVKSDLIVQIIKLVFGLTVLLAIRALIKLILPEMIVFDFFRYFLIAIWITVGAPYLFKRYTSKISKSLSKDVYIRKA